MPEADGLVHGGGEDEEVLGPGDVQEVAGVPRVRHKGPVHEDVTLDVSAKILYGTGMRCNSCCCHYSTGTVYFLKPCKIRTEYG
jgi:hypothetical protein